jgi:hypothetical protein
VQLEKFFLFYNLARATGRSFLLPALTQAQPLWASQYNFADILVFDIFSSQTFLRQRLGVFSRGEIFACDNLFPAVNSTMKMKFPRGEFSVRLFYWRSRTT